MTVINKNISTVTTKKGNCSLRIAGEDGLIKTLHSLYDPEAEAKAIVNDFQFNGMGILVVLGLGLGYHIVELVKKYPDTEIIVIEALNEIHEIAKSYGPELRGNIKIITGQLPEEALKQITGYQMKEGIRPVSVFALYSVVAAFPTYYKPILASLNKTVSVKLWEKLRYKKFRENTSKVLLIDSGYFLVQEVEKALKALNHKVAKISVKKGSDSEAFIPAFIDTILNFKPDFLLTINHLGFDEDGVMTSFFKSIEMPVASWYVDSPKLILQSFYKNVSPYVSMFMWDTEYIEQTRQSGFESVQYLPLAADEDIFRPIKKNSKLKIQSSKFACDVGFVGSSLYDSTREKSEKVPENLHHLVEETAYRLSSRRASLKDVIINSEDEKFNNLTYQERLDFEASVLWKATLFYRLSCIEELKQFNVCIHGDEGWKALLNSSYNIKPPLNYYKELPAFYNACRINFNATHFQMKEAVNQRVFDVPSCGSFLLTDYQKSLNELFDIGKEIIVYKEKGEIPELVKYYLDNPEKRGTVARKGMERVLKEHTYKHRLKSLIRFMRERFEES